LPDAYIFAIGLVIFLAWLVPEFGSRRNFLSLHTFGHYGVSVVFFFYGLGLNKEKLAANLGNFRLHIVVQISTFAAFPILVLLLQHFFVSDTSRDLWLGTFYLAALPSTVSSSVVMVSLARGNIPAAIFNASISSMFGIFITPIWMSLFLSVKNADFDLIGNILDLAQIVVLPIVLGMLFHRTKFGTFIVRRRNFTNRFDQAVILTIIHTSFCDSFAHHIFSGYTLFGLLMIIFLLALLFFAMYGSITLVCRLMKFNREDTITATFCGSKKSMMHGTVMSKVLFRGYPSVGEILLPLMLYHALQLMIVSIIAMKKAKESDCKK